MIWAVWEQDEAETVNSPFSVKKEKLFAKYDDLMN